MGYEIDGEVTHDVPVSAKLFEAKPVYESLPGWKTDVRGMTNYADFPEELKAYVSFIEMRIGVPIHMVSTGPKREDICLR